MYGQFLQEMPETLAKDKTWEWTRKSDLTVETEAVIFAAQELTGTENELCYVQHQQVSRFPAL